MKKIDWFILKKFLSTFFGAIFIFLSIAIVVDITEKIDDFINNNAPLYKIVFQYYLGFIPYISALLFPLFTFISVIFFTSKMAYKSEIIAILGSGVSFRRMLRPFMMGALLLAFMLWLGNQWVVPRANKARQDFEDVYYGSGKKDISSISNIHFRIDTSTYISMFSYDPTYKSAYGFTMEKINGEQLYYKLESQRISYDTAKHVWNTGRAVIRRINGLHESIKQINDTSLHLALLPKDLLKETNVVQSMTTPQLNTYIAKQQLRGFEGLNYLYVEKYRRLASAFSLIILTLIGAIIASRKVRGGSGLHLALGIAISAAYIVIMQFSTVFSTKGNFSPLLAVWLPNIFFSILAYLLYRRAPK